MFPPNNRGFRVHVDLSTFAGFRKQKFCHFCISSIQVKENPSMVFKFNSNFSPRHLSMSVFSVAPEKYQVFSQMLHDF